MHSPVTSPPSPTDTHARKEKKLPKSETPLTGEVPEDMKQIKTQIMKALLVIAIIYLGKTQPAKAEQEDGIFTDSKIDLVYEESFAIIMVVTNSTPIRVTLKEMQKKINAMKNTDLTFNLGG